MIESQKHRLQQRLQEIMGRISYPLIDAENKPEGENSDGDEEQIHQPFMPHPPASQGEFGADQNMHQEEEDQKQVQIGVHAFGLI